MVEAYTPLSAVLPSNLVPGGLFDSSSLGFLDNVACLVYNDRAAGEDTLDVGAEEFKIFVRCKVMTEARIPIPFLKGMELVLGKGDSEDTGLIDVNLSVRLHPTDPPDIVLRLTTTVLSLSFGRDMLKPVEITEDEDGHVSIEVKEGKVAVPLPFDLVLKYENEDWSFDFEAPAGVSTALSLPPAMVGESGVVIEAEGVSLNFQGGGVAVPPGAPTDWKGVYLAEVDVYIPSLFDGSIEGTKLGIGTGGFYGTIGGNFALAFNPSTKAFTGPLATSVLGMSGGISSIDLSFVQNVPTAFAIEAKILLPFFEKPVDVTIGLDAAGGFTAGLSAAGGLAELEVQNVMKIKLDGIRFKMNAGVATISISGDLKPLFGTPALDWPTFKVKELSIDSKGKVKLDGGWLDLDRGHTLNFHGFKIEITKLGFGTNDDGRKWVGFSGALKLVDSLPAGASVEGLRVTWNPTGNPNPKITLEGVGVEFEVPGTLSFKGHVSYKELTVGGNTIHRFDGDINLKLLALDLEFDGKLVVGSVSGVDGSYTFLAIYVGMEMPAGIPLAPTPVALYGFAGLFALNMEPDRNPAHPWYAIPQGADWYHKNPTGVAEFDKWRIKKGRLALGAGVTIGTSADNGYTFSGKFLLLILFPGPIVMIDGLANLLKKRAALNEEPMFRSLAIIDKPSGTLTVGLDAQYKYGADGGLIDVRGGAEAFFNFNDPTDWHLYLGKKDPREQRIRARLFKMFDANAYFMLDGQKLQVGAWVGFARTWKFMNNKVSLALEAWMEAGAVVSWSPPHFHGEVLMHAHLQLKAFKFGVSLTADAGISADVFDPFHLLGKVHVVLDLPKPFPDVDVDATLEWGPQKVYPAIPAVFQEVAVEHFKVTTKWPLVTTSTLSSSVPSGASIVPVDGRPHITFARAVNDDAGVGLNPQPTTPEWERLGDPATNTGPVSVRYSVKEVTLYAWQGSAWTLVARAGSTPNAAGVKDLYGSWAPVPAMPAGDGTAVAQNKLWLWAKTPFAYSAHSGTAWDEWFTKNNPLYPCIPPAPDRIACCDFQGLQLNSQVSPPYTRDGLGVSIGWTPKQRLTVVPLASAIGGRDRAVCLDARRGDTGSSSRVMKFSAEDVKAHPNPFTHQGVRFRLYDKQQKLFQHAFVRAVTPGTKPPYGLDCDYILEAELPVETSSVTVKIVQIAGTAQVLGLDPSGAVAAQSATTGTGAPEDVTLSGSNIKTIVVRALNFKTYVLELGWSTPVVGPSSGFTVTVAEPADRVEITVRDPDGVTARAVDGAGAVLKTVTGGTPASPTIVIEHDRIEKVLIAPNGRACLVSVCANIPASQNEITRREEMLKHLSDQLAVWSQTGNVLSPNTDYAVGVATLADARGVGELAGDNRMTSATTYGYFRTAGPPAIAGSSGVAALPAPTGHPNPTEFRSGLDDLTAYVEQTVPPTVVAPGERPALPRPVYRSYDEGVSFNEDYVDLMYRMSGRDLSLLLFDVNNQPVRDAQGRIVVRGNPWGRTEQRSMSASEERWTQVLSDSACVAFDPSVIPGNVTLAAANGLVLDPDTVYEARLVPVLVHDDFTRPPLGAVATGGQTIGRWIVKDEGTFGGPSQWKIGEAGTPLTRYVGQASPVRGSSTSWSNPGAPGTVLLRASDPKLPSTHADQPANWTDYRATFVMRIDHSAAAGVEFRHQNNSTFYRFAINPGSRNRRLTRHTGTTTVILAGERYVPPPGSDLLVTVEAVGPSLRILVDGETAFAVEDAAITRGGIGLYTWGDAAARFSDVHVDDLSATAPVAYRFSFTSGQFANFVHQMHSFDDRVAPTLTVPATAPAVAQLAWTSSPSSAISDAEAKDHGLLAEALIGPAAHQRSDKVDIAPVVANGETVALFVRSPEPFDWARTSLEARGADMELPAPHRPEEVKIIDATGSSTGDPTEEAVEVILRDPVSLDGRRIELLRLPGPLAETVGSPTLLRDSFDHVGGPLFEETYPPDALGHYQVIDEGGLNGPSAWALGAGTIVQSSEINDGSSSALTARRGTIAVTGDPAWRDLAITTVLESSDDGALGVVFRYEGPDDWYRFSIDKGRSVRSLVRMTGGAATVLWQDGGGYVANQPYALQLLAFGDRLIGYLNHVPLFDVVDAAPGHGRVGFYSWRNQGSTFEGLRIEELRTPVRLWAPDLVDLSEMEEVTPAGGTGGPPAWAAATGEVTQTSDFQVNAPGRVGTMMVGGDSSWGDVRFSADLRSDDVDAIGIVFRYEDADNHYRFSMNRQDSYRRLVRWSGGTPTVLWEDQVKYTVGKTYSLTVEASGATLRGWLDGAPLFAVTDGAHRHGRVGLYSWANTGARFRRLLVTDAARRLGDWVVHDETVAAGPSRWIGLDGRLIQRTAIAEGTAADEFRGTWVERGDRSWTDVRIAAVMQADGPRGIGVLFRVVDEDNYYRLSFDAQLGHRWLVKVVDGVATELWDAPTGHQPGRPFSVTIEAVGDRLTGWIGKQPLFAVEDDAHSHGAIGLWTWGDAAARFGRVEVRIPPIASRALFRDELVTGGMAGWTVVDQGTVDAPSTWAVLGRELRQTRSIRSSTQAGVGRPGTVALAGDPTWDDILFLTRLKSLDDDGIGVVFRYTDGANYYRFSMDRAEHYRRLVKRVNGVVSVLWEDTVDYVKGRSYDLAILARGGELTGWLDGIPLFAVEDSDLGAGQIGMYSWGNTDARFSDVMVLPADQAFANWDVFDNFAALRDDMWSVVDDASTGTPSAWEIQAGGLCETSGFGGGSGATRTGTVVVADGERHDIRVVVNLRPGASGSAGVAVRHQGSGDHYAFVIDAGAATMELVCRQAGVTTPVWSEALPPATHERILTVDDVGDKITCYLDGVLVGDAAVDDAFPDAGRVGLRAIGSAGACFSKIRVGSPYWSPWYTFSEEPALPAGTTVTIQGGAGTTTALKAGQIRRAVAPFGPVERARIPSGGARLRVVDTHDVTEHERAFSPANQVVDVAVLRSADATALFLAGATPSIPSALAAAPLRLRLTYRRDNRALDPTSLVLSQDGSTADEVAVIDVPGWDV